MGCALVGGLIGLGLDSQSSGSDLTGGLYSQTICNFGRYRNASQNQLVSFRGQILR